MAGAGDGRRREPLRGAAREWHASRRADGGDRPPHGNGCVALLSGELGVGKSRIAQAVVSLDPLVARRAATGFPVCRAQQPAMPVSA
jgi:hypothetical protein